MTSLVSDAVEVDGPLQEQPRASKQSSAAPTQACWRTGGCGGRPSEQCEPPGFAGPMSLAASTVYRDMSKVRVHISVSVDGYVAGPNQSLENPLGEGGEGLHDWVVALKGMA